MSIIRYAGDRFIGLSTDEKPVNVLDGAFFTETNTFRSYIKVNGSWEEVIGKIHEHVAVDITDFDTEVSNNSDVSANTSSRHTQDTDTSTNSTSFEVGKAVTLGGGCIEVIAVVQTTTSDWTTLWSLSLANGDVIGINAIVIGKTSANINQGFYQQDALIIRSENTTSRIGTTLISGIESDANWDCRIVADDTNEKAVIQVKGGADTTINWKSIIRYLKISA